MPPDEGTLISTIGGRLAIKGEGDTVVLGRLRKLHKVKLLKSGAELHFGEPDGQVWFVQEMTPNTLAAFLRELEFRADRGFVEAAESSSPAEVDRPKVTEADSPAVRKPLSQGFVALALGFLALAGLLVLASVGQRIQQTEQAEARRKQAESLEQGRLEAEAERKKAVATGVRDAKKVLASPTGCDAPRVVSDILGALTQAKTQDAEWYDAVGLLADLEPCRKSSEKVAALEKQAAEKKAAAAAEAAAMLGRVAWAKRAEKGMLANGMEVDFIVEGSKKDQLTVKWILMSKVQVYKLTNDNSIQEGSFLGNMQKAGFRQVTFTDGYNYSVSYELHPTN